MHYLFVEGVSGRISIYLEVDYLLSTVLGLLTYQWHYYESPINLFTVT